MFMRQSVDSLSLKSTDKLQHKAMRNFENLLVWKKSCQLACAVYEAFDKSRDYALVNQLTRASVSIPSNIAEGSERHTEKEFVNFLYIAKGSAGELRTQIYIASKLGMITPQQQQDLITRCKEVSRMIARLINQIDNK